MQVVNSIIYLCVRIHTQTLAVNYSRVTLQFDRDMTYFLVCLEYVIMVIRIYMYLVTR
jgi:hypothetical protein